MNDSETDATPARECGVPEMLPDRDELARAEVAAYWLATGERDPLAVGLMPVEVFTRALHLADVKHEAAPGHRLRLRLGDATQKIAITEEPDTGSVFVWDALAPTGGVVPRSAAAVGNRP